MITLRGKSAGGDAIHAAWIIATRLPQDVLERVTIEVFQGSSGGLQAIATLNGTARRTDYPQGPLPFGEFAVFAARHFEQWAEARLPRAS